MPLKTNVPNRALHRREDKCPECGAVCWETPSSKRRGFMKICLMEECVLCVH